MKDCYKNSHVKWVLQLLQWITNIYFKENYPCHLSFQIGWPKVIHIILSFIVQWFVILWFCSACMVVPSLWFLVLFICALFSLISLVKDCVSLLDFFFLRTNFWLYLFTLLWLCFLFSLYALIFIHVFCHGSNCVPLPPKDVEVLTPGTSPCDLIWK